MAYSLGNVSAKAVLDASPFLGEAKRMAVEYNRITRGMAKEAGVTQERMMRDLARSVMQPGQGIAGTRREMMEMSREVQRYRSGMVSSTADASRPEFAMAGVRNMGTREMHHSIAAARKETATWVESVVKLEAGIQATRLVIDASVVGAKLLSGEFKDIRQAAEELTKLPIIGGLIGSGLGAWSYAAADDVKAEYKADQKSLDRKNAAKARSTDQTLTGWDTASWEAAFQRDLMRMGEQEREFAKNERGRGDELQSLQKELDALRQHGTLRADVLQRARERELAIHKEYDARAKDLSDKFYNEDWKRRYNEHQERLEQAREQREREEKEQQRASEEQAREAAQTQEQARAMAADYLAAASGTFGTEIGAGVNVESVDAINRSNAAREEAIQRQMLVALERIAANTGKPREGVAAP